MCLCVRHYLSGKRWEFCEHSQFQQQKYHNHLWKQKVHGHPWVEQRDKYTLEQYILHGYLRQK